MSERQPRKDQGHGWCSLRLRFSERELTLLRGAEQVRGAALATHGRPDGLRTALTLAKAGHKVAHATPDAPVVLEEGELLLLLEAVRFAIDEVHWAAGPEAVAGMRQQATLDGFPELVQSGLWRSFSLTRDLQSLAERLHAVTRS